MIRGSALLVVILLGLVSCQEAPFFSQEHVLNEAGWNHEEPVTFTFAVVDTSLRYDLFLDIDHSEEYAYENVYAKTITTYPDGEEKEQMLPINLANKAGQWYGKCLGASCKARVALQENAFFDQLGSHSIAFEQFTRNNPLEGLVSLRLVVEQRK
ncbi:MAG: gliding motility lipoprotein GldH [Saprospiraceae bacterium]|nr:gliding motility lipoprotein GldH [Saprospiraceae bacterium]